MGINVRSAGGLAEHLVGHHGRKDAAGLWLPSKVQAMDIHAIVMALAERGVTTNEGSFRGLAARYVSSPLLSSLRRDRVPGFAWLFSPACAGRRMAEGAAHLVDWVIPHVATR
ncbi:MAG: hypothetical protein EXR71_14115 [Myxococcales bacterium]|nr:hypothetical protein [Myxococcales bacterium]